MITRYSKRQKKIKAVYFIKRISGTYAKLVLLKSEFNSGCISQSVIIDLALGLLDFLTNFLGTRPIVFALSSVHNNKNKNLKKRI